MEQAVKDEDGIYRYADDTPRDGCSCAEGKPVTQKMLNDQQKTRLGFARGYAETLYAVELLEYHDKNFLQHGTNPKLLSEQKQEIFRELLRQLKTARASIFDL